MKNSHRQEIPQKNLYEIGTVARMTGIQSNVMRTWERRGFLEPNSRTQSGRRLYSNDTVQKLCIIKTLLDHGEQISSLAKLDYKELKLRVQEFQNNENLAAVKMPTVIHLSVIGEGLNNWFKHLSPVFRIQYIALNSLENIDIQNDVCVVDIDSFNLIDESLIKKKFGNPSEKPIIILYNFALSKQIKELTKQGYHMMRWPQPAILIEKYVEDVYLSHRFGHDSILEHSLEDDISLRVLTDFQLAAISNANPKLQCECPHHLTSLVSNLNAFVDYSLNCKVESKADAEVHQNLAKQTARARSIIEEALIELCKTDGISIPNDGGTQ